MTIQMKKVWFVDGQIIEQEIPESDIYKQEPVAWISENAGLYHFKPDKSLNPLPLYLAPPPCPTCEALARTVMLDQTSHDTTPQRDLESTTDMMMELADRLGELPDDIDPRAWEHLLVYAPKRQPMTDEDLDLMCEKALFCRISFQQFARSIEAAHNIKE